MTPGEKIVEVATRFVGLHETAANVAWDNPATPEADASAVELKKLLLSVGWQDGWSYCSAFCEAVWKQAYTELKTQPIILQRIATMLTPSVMDSLRNWTGHIATVGQPGAIFFMQKGSSWQGHAGIVCKVSGDKMATIEGNTSPDPKDADADREGDGIFRRTRNAIPPSIERPGLWLRGFLNPLGV